MKNRGRSRLTSSIWGQALEQQDALATELIDRAVAALGAGIASAVNLLDVEAVIIGGGLGRSLRAADGRADLHRDAPAPVQRLAPAGRPGGRSRRPGRRDRRSPAGASTVRRPSAATLPPAAPGPQTVSSLAAASSSGRMHAAHCRGCGMAR